MNVLNRTTKQYIKSANTPDYPLIDWIHNPDLSLVAGFDSRYWVINGDAVTLMSQAERDTVDAAILSAAKDYAANEIDTDVYLSAFALVVLDEINILRAAHSLTPRTKAQLKTAVRGKM